MNEDWSIRPEIRLKSLAETAKVEINPSIKAICYVRTGRELIRSAENYYEDGSTENAYTLYMRFLTLFVEKFKSHPGYKELPDIEKKSIVQQCKSVFSVAEKMKSELLAKFQKEFESYEENIKKEEEKRETQQLKIRQMSAEHKSITPLSTNSQHFINSEDYRPTAPPPVEPFPKTNYFSTGPSLVAGAGSNMSKISCLNDAVVSKFDKNETKIHPSFDRSSKPYRLVSPMGLGGGGGNDNLRTVVIPGDLLTKFISLAASNTLRNIETCGVLGGNINQDKLVITHLILPKQTGTSDSCTTLNEEEIYTIIDRYSLIQMGWIHTHPSQTSFLSSVDLHSHLPYQLMLPESIAIVCAPTKQESNVFTLTPIGLEILQKCTQVGFHPHNQSETLFTDAEHAVTDMTRFTKVNDLR